MLPVTKVFKVFQARKEIQVRRGRKVLKARRVFKELPVAREIKGFKAPPDLKARRALLVHQRLAKLATLQLSGETCSR